MLNGRTSAQPLQLKSVGRNRPPIGLSPLRWKRAQGTCFISEEAHRICHWGLLMKMCSACLKMARGLAIRDGGAIWVTRG